MIEMSDPPVLCSQYTSLHTSCIQTRAYDGWCDTPGILLPFCQRACLKLRWSHQVTWIHRWYGHMVVTSILDLILLDVWNAMLSWLDFPLSFISLLVKSLQHLFSRYIWTRIQLPQLLVPALTWPSLVVFPFSFLSVGRVSWFTGYDLDSWCCDCGSTIDQLFASNAVLGRGDTRYIINGVTMTSQHPYRDGMDSRSSSSTLHLELRILDYKRPYIITWSIHW
jgi:hypothetical protein